MTRSMYLHKLWQVGPLSWAIIRTVEVGILSQQEYIPPILEVGCGDGLVTQLIFHGNFGAVDVGIDLDRHELNRAKKTGMYKKLVQVDICNSSFKSRSFNTIFANGVLEHISDLSKALSEISRLLKKGGVLITTSPTDNYQKLLFYYRLFRFLGLPKVANKYGSFINNSFNHQHLYGLNKWQAFLGNVGLTIEEYKYYNNPNAVVIHELALPLSLFSKTFKAYTDKLALFPTLRSLFVIPLSPLIETFLETDSLSDPKKNASIFIRARS